MFGVNSGGHVTPDFDERIALHAIVESVISVHEATYLGNLACSLLGR
jgi:hypothetical protein